MKKSISWTIDEEIIEKVKKEAEKQESRSESFVVNKILKEHYDKK